MKSFTFRGERILEWRRVQADEARGEFLRASASEREAAALAEAAQARADRAAQESIDVLGEPVGIDTIERYRIWIAKERRHADGCRQAQHERQQVAETKASALQLAHRHVKVMERLRERAERRHRDLERQLDAKALDELATQRYASRQADEGADT